MKLFVDQRSLVHYCVLLFGSLFFSLAARMASEKFYPLAFFSFVLAVLFAWISVVREVNEAAIYMPDSMRRPVHWIYAETFEIFALIVLGFLRVTSPFRKSQSISCAFNTRPILLVHGYLNAGHVWDFHKKILAKNGFGPIYTIDLGHPFQSIRSYALKVQEKARQIAKETGSSDLNIIGHSMGGLVSYYYVAKLAQAYSVPQLITIGSPLQGTRIAKIGFGQCAHDMRPDSELIKEMHVAIESCNDVKFYNIATRTDVLVVPYTSAFFKSESQHQLCFDDIGHTSLLFSKRVSNQLCAWLKNP
jgi:hypothetical protein